MKISPLWILWGRTRNQDLNVVGSPLAAIS